MNPTSSVAASQRYRQRLLSGCFGQAEFIEHLRTRGTPDTYARLDDWQAGWRTAQHALQGLAAQEAGLFDHLPQTPLPAALRNRTSALAQTTAFRRAFAQSTWRFEWLPIDRLISSQRAVNLDFVDELAKEFASNTSPEALFSYCFESRPNHDAVGYLESASNAHLFSSPSGDFRFLGSYLKRLEEADQDYAMVGGIPAAALIVLVGFGSPVAQGYRYQGRVMVMNGTHRLVALRQIGVEQAPLLVRMIERPEIECPQSINGLSQHFLLGAPRPPGIRDFFNSDLCTTIHARAVLRAVSVNVHWSHLDVPL